MQEMLQNSLTTGQYLLTLLSFHLIQHVDAELKGHARRSEPVSAWTTLCTPKPQTASQKTRTAVRGVSATTAFLVTPGTQAQHPASLHPSQTVSFPACILSLLAALPRCNQWHAQRVPAPAAMGAFGIPFHRVQCNKILWAQHSLLGACYCTPS